MLCPNCLTMNEENALVCTKCGRDFQTGVVPKENQEPISGSFAIPVGRTGLSIAAGYLGLFSVLLIPAPVSLVVSIMALLQLKKNPGKLGRGRAVFGLIMGTFGTVVLLYLLILFFS